MAINATISSRNWIQDDVPKLEFFLIEDIDGVQIVCEDHNKGLYKIIKIKNDGTFFRYPDPPNECIVVEGLKVDYEGRIVESDEEYV